MTQAPADLHHTAVEAMRERGLRADFAAEAMRQAEAAGQASHEQHGDIRDLRTALWFSIDNDDTRDLDQLSVAEALAGGAARLRVAVADVDALGRAGSRSRRACRRQHHLGLHRRRRVPDAAESLSTDLTSLHEGQERLAVVVDMRVEPDGTVSDRGAIPRLGPQPRQAHLRRASLPGSTARRRRPRQLATVPASRSSCACTTARPASCGGGARPRRAKHEHHRRRGRCSTDGRLVDLRPDEQEPRQGPDRRPDDRDQRRDGPLPGGNSAFRRCAACCRRRAAGTASSRWPPVARRRAAAAARRGGARRASCVRGAPPIRTASPTCPWRS